MGHERSAAASRYRFVILGLACALAFMGNYLQYQVTALAVGVMDLLAIDTAGFQLLFLMPMLAAVFFSIPLGVLGDKFGPKRVVAVAYVIALLGAALRVCDLSNFGLQLACVFMIGVGMTALTANNAKTLGLWFGKCTDWAMGLYYACSCLGISASQATAGMFGSIAMSYIASDVVLAAIVVLWIAFDRNMPPGELPPENAGSTPAFSRVVRNRNVWLIALAAGLMLSATTGYAGILPQALELDRGMDTISAGQMSSLLTLASMFACLLTPVFCARFGKVKTYLLAMGVLGAVVMFANWFVPGADAAFLAVLLLNGFVTSLLGPILQALPILLPGIGARFAGSAGGIIAETSLLLSFFLPIAVSALAGADYSLNFALFSGCFACALVPMAFLPGALAEQE